MGNGTDQIVTSYTYDPVTRELRQISYNDGADAISYGDPTDWDNRSNVKNRDRLGRVRSVIDALGTRTLGYDVAGQLESESIGNMNLVRDIDGFGRPLGYDLTVVSPVQDIDCGYDARGRFESVSFDINSKSDTLTYTWADGANLLTGYSSAGGSPAVSVAYTYEDNRDLKTGVLNKSLGADVSQYVYVYDEIGRRKQRTDDSSLVNKFKYNERSEVVEADMDGTAGYEDIYVFDDIGNRTSVSGDGGTTTVPYVPDNLNQYDTVDGTTFIHGVDGNLAIDGTWRYAWNAENRLVSMEKITPENGSKRLEFKYDFMGRRYEKKVYAYNTTTPAFELQTTTTFVYNGWNMIHETTTPQSPALPVTRSYVWGLDLSRSLQGAGGVGGLLTTVVSDTTDVAYYPVGDANGNITDYVDESGTVVASYSYDAFGKHTSSGTKADNFTFRFSSKYWDSETGLSYYGFRYYSAELGCWLNRDPIEEQGGVNVYGFVGNDINKFDILGAVGEPGYEIWGPLAPEIEPPGPQGPSFFDHFPDWLGGPSEGDFVDNTEWFESNYSFELGGFKSDAMSAIVDGICNNETPTYSVTWYPDQSYLSSQYVLGNVQVSVENVAFTMKGRKYNYTATFVVEDGLGFDSGENANNPWERYFQQPIAGWFFQDRDVTRSQSSLSGSGCCEEEKE